MLKVVQLILILFVSLQALAATGVIEGTIIDAKGQIVLTNVLIQVQRENISDKSDSSGFFRIKGIGYGIYDIVFVKKGYYSLVYPDVKVDNSQPVHLNIEMVQGNENEFLFLEIGGIHVTANKNLLADEPETVYHISSGELAHRQANSLADVLNLIPGNYQNEIPGLKRKQNITLRTFDEAGEDQAALFGTKIIIDDIPLSNNADMHTGNGVGFGASVTLKNNNQVDLREIPADNLEKVEILAGPAGVEYGDYSQGVVIATTKMQNVPTQLKIKNNLDTREANLIGSISGINTDFVYNINYGYSERDIRIRGDEYQRISANLKTRNKLNSKNLDLTQLFRYSRMFEEDNNDNDPNATKAYNRDYELTYSHQFDWNINASTNFYLRNFITYRNRNSWKRKFEAVDNLLWTTALTEGTFEAVSSQDSAGYFSEVSTKGEEWSIGSKLRLKKRYHMGKTLHRFLAGAEYLNDFNNGEGKYYDLLKSPNGRISERPRRFDDIPGTKQFSLFFEDRISGKILFPYTFSLGFRIDSYNPKSLKLENLFNDKDIFESSQGTFFNPRIGLKIIAFPKTQLRFSYGKSSKTPPISRIYPSDFYLDVYELAAYLDTTDNRIKHLDVASTYVLNTSAENLKGYQSTKYEFSIDQGFGDLGFNLNLYYQKTVGIPINVKIPFIYNKYFWYGWPVIETIYTTDKFTATNENYSISKNIGKDETTGLEFNFTTHRITDLNMRFRINAAFTFKKYKSDNYKIFGSTRTYSFGDTLPSGNITEEKTQLIPYYYPEESWRQRAVINYHVDYLHKKLGIWLTFDARQVLWFQIMSISKTRPYAIGYFQDGEYYDLDPETSDHYNFTKTYRNNDITVDKSRPNNQWMFSMVLSKSIFEGTEVSLYVKNILNDRAYYLSRNNLYLPRNHEMFWGIAFSSLLDDWF